MIRTLAAIAALLAAAPATAAPPSAPTPVVTILGDSITAGLGLPETQAAPAQLQVFQANGLWLTVNAAMGVPDLASACGWMERTRPDFELPYGGPGDGGP